MILAEEMQASVAIFFDADAYSEAHGRSGVKGGPAGLMGRQVAGKEFLDGYLEHGDWKALTAVVRSRERAEPLAQLCKEHPSSREKLRRLIIHQESEFLTAFGCDEPPARVVHFPCPMDTRYAWARQATGGRFALSGITHTLSTISSTKALCDLVAAPFEPFDALICTSRAVVSMVQSVTASYADFLADRFGGTRPPLPRLEMIPLGVNPDRFRPATEAERQVERARFGIGDEEIMVLCVGRLSHHAKAHPYPAFYAAEEAARGSGKKVVLVFAGWAAHPAIDTAFREGAKQFAHASRVLFVDGIDPNVRSGVWRAADVFLSLPDNIQETFGLVVVEGMSSGLPVVGSDWDGYRDLVVEGETGFLVSTTMIQGATQGATMRLLFGQSSYDRFLGECCQTVTVDLKSAAEALTKLVVDAGLRRRMGIAGRSRVMERFTWAHVIRSYEALWREQEREVLAWKPKPSATAPATYPAPETSFAGYPTKWLTEESLVCTNADAVPSLDAYLYLPLTNLLNDRRCADRATLSRLLQHASEPRTIRALAQELENSGIERTAARATIAWLMKYGMLISSQN